MRHTVVVALAIALGLSFGGCSGTKDAGKPTASPAATSSEYDAAAAERLWSAALETRGRSNMGTIPESQWAPAIRELDPLRVYVHALDIVIVLEESESQESGKYVVSGLSSRTLQQGYDGFTLSPDPDRKSQRAGHWREVYEYTRDK